MQFELNEDQALLRSSTRELLENEAPLEQTRGVMEESTEGYPKDIYAQLAELGYAGLLLSEEDGGLGPLAFAIVMVPQMTNKLISVVADSSVYVRNSYREKK